MTVPTHSLDAGRRVYVWITDDESAELDAIANHWGSSRAAIVRHALGKYLAAWRDAEIEDADGEAEAS